jgi:hypothetical protein
MRQQKQNAIGECCPITTGVVSRRLAVGSSVLALVVALSRSAFSAEQGKEAGRDRNMPDSGTPGQAGERTERSQMLSGRTRGAGGMEERLRMMQERSVLRHQQAIEDLREQLRVSGQEWKVIKPRLEAVYNLVRPLPRMGTASDRKPTEVEQKGSELRGLLRNEGAPADQIKAGLTALRAAKERARQELATAQQNLRQILTLRQEALLVLNGLLD